MDPQIITDVAMETMQHQEAGFSVLSLILFALFGAAYGAKKIKKMNQ